ncbi:MAG TPA: Trm112 family protein [Thermodesulfobacteriota bacterium]|nr:Trm112 family protein [Thermodesulfobacteriota bacterium]
MTMDKELLAILACPKCKNDVKLNSSGDGIECGVCRVVYPVKDGIPVMLVEEARDIRQS